MTESGGMGLDSHQGAHRWALRNKRPTDKESCEGWLVRQSVKGSKQLRIVLELRSRTVNPQPTKGLGETNTVKIVLQVEEARKRD